MNIPTINIPISGPYPLTSVATSQHELCASIVNGFFTKDGSAIESYMQMPNFDCSCLGLYSLKGAPLVVNGSYICSDNKLTTLEGGPKFVKTALLCEYNSFTDLHDIDKHCPVINGICDFRFNPIKSHVLGLLKIKGLRHVKMDNEQVQNIINQHLFTQDILACIDELHDAGLEEYAKL